MREILFRGKRIDNDEWVYGSFCMDALELKNGPCGVDGFIRLYDFEKGNIQMHEVDRETVGQFTGLTDKNGKKVIEGDIFKTKCNIGVIRFREDQATFGFEIWWKGFPDDFATFKEFGKPSFEIIGNIHDNPELLEVSK